MKKKVYFILTSVIQIIVSIAIIATAEKIAQTQLDSLEQIYAGFPADFQERMRKMLENGGRFIVSIPAIISLIMNTVILREAVTNNILKKKGKLIALSLVCLLATENAIILILSLLNIIILALLKRKNPEDFPEKQKKEIPAVEYKEATKKEMIFALVVLIVYFSQFILASIINLETFIQRLIVQILVDVVILVLVILCFKDKLKRDLKLFKENAKAYLQYILPKIGIIYLLFLLVSIVSTLISKEASSVNQETLETLPKWYMAPMAIIWAPIVEELIFRGIFRRFIKNNTIFIIVSGAIFGVLHTIGEASLANIIIMAMPYAVLGGGWAYLYAKTDNITNNILAHSFQNTLATLLSLMIM